MASNNTYSHSINLRYILESQKLSRENFLDWEKNLRIVLDRDRKLYILETDPPKTPKANARASELTSFKKYEDDVRDVKCIIMASMTAELQRLHADMEVHPMIQRLRDLYQGQPQNSDIYVIKVNMSDFTSWLMDTGCGSHILEPERQDLVSRLAQVLPRRSDRMRNPPVRYSFLVSDEGDVLLVDQGEPETYLEAIMCPESEQWLNAMKSEMESMYTNQTWLSKNFAMKDLGNASYAFGIRIYRDRYQGNPGEAHWTAVKNIVKYLRNTKDAFLVYGGEEELKVIGYTDASFQTDRDDYKSQVGYVVCLNGGAFSWKSSKQDTTADSTTEAEYMAAAEAAKEGVWIKKFISELGVVPSINDPIPLFCDNTGAIAEAKEPRSHQKTKNIVRRYHIIREIIDRGDVEICKVGTDDNIADPLTKPLGKLKHEGHTRSMGIRPMPDWP
ncbi:unnamed protein product [Cuscuta campestris]|uniref:Reverse transcriptase Ty1/copia-type domain-containing protein n=1 Tax=Cuscuta campestris TaxID=132261 RepID=A0A484L3G8_9ASTE|nr:unnamed protein product [Cuscuta campestris]